MTAGITPIQWLGPLPPSRTGIAAYCHDILSAVDGLWPIELFVEDGAETDFQAIRESKRKTICPELPAIIQLGNSENHELAFRAALVGGGILVLHDVVLHHALLARHVRQRTDREYWRELEARYGVEGVRVGRAILAGRVVEDLQDNPLSERYIEAASMVLVHSEYAAKQVRRHVPTANVRTVLMGLPLPREISQAMARERLGIDSSEYLVASITHVNPNKRLPVVLRAIRRLASRIPETRFIIAGSGSDSADLRREVRLLGLQNIVDCRGYVNDGAARLLAAASDVCVNLRYPSTGETSASLLRLLAAGKPVLVSDDGSASELPGHVAFKIAPDKLEVDIITEVLYELASNDGLRAEVGQQAREWVREVHSMGAAIDGYRRAIESVYGVKLPGLPDPIIYERAQSSPRSVAEHRSRGFTSVSAVVGDAIADLGLSPDSPIVAHAARAIAELRLESTGHREGNEFRLPSARLLDRVECQVCGGDLTTNADEVQCQECGVRVELESGAPHLVSRPTFD